MSRLQVLSVPYLDLTSQMTPLPAKGHEYRKRSAAMHSALSFILFYKM